MLNYEKDAIGFTQHLFDQGRLGDHTTKGAREAIERYYALNRSSDDLSTSLDKYKDKNLTLDQLEKEIAASEGVEVAKGVISDLKAEIRKVQAELGGIGEPSHAAVGELQERIREAHGIIQDLQAGRLTVAAAYAAIQGIKVGAEAAIHAASHEVGLDIGDAKIGIYEDYQQYEFAREMSNIYERNGNTINNDEMRRHMMNRLENTVGDVTTNQERKIASDYVTGPLSPDLDRMMKHDKESAAIVADKIARSVAGSKDAQRAAQIAQSPKGKESHQLGIALRERMAQFVKDNPQHAASKDIQRLLDSNFSLAMGNKGLAASFDMLAARPDSKEALDLFNKHRRKFEHVSDAHFFNSLLHPVDKEREGHSGFKDLKVREEIRAKIEGIFKKDNISLEDLRTNPSLYRRLSEQNQIELSHIRSYLQGKGPRPDGMPVISKNDERNAVSAAGVSSGHVVAYNLRNADIKRKLNLDDRHVLSETENRLVTALNTLEGVPNYRKLEGDGIGGLLSNTIHKKRAKTEFEQNPISPKDRMDALVTILKEQISGDENSPANQNLKKAIDLIQNDKDHQLFLMDMLAGPDAKPGHQIKVSDIIDVYSKDNYEEVIAARAKEIRNNPERANALSRLAIQGTNSANRVKIQDAKDNKVFGDEVRAYLKLSNNISTAELSEILHQQRISVIDEKQAEAKIKELLENDDHRKELDKVNGESKEAIIRMLEGIDPESAAVLKDHIKTELEKTLKEKHGLTFDDLSNPSLNRQYVREITLKALAEIDFSDNKKFPTFVDEKGNLDKKAYDEAREKIATYRPDHPDLVELKLKVARFEARSMNEALPVFHATIGAMALDQQYGGVITDEFFALKSVEERIQFLKEAGAGNPKGLGLIRKNDWGAEMVTQAVISKTMTAGFARTVDPEFLKRAIEALPQADKDALLKSNPTFMQTFNPRELKSKEDFRAVGDAALKLMIKDGVTIAALSQQRDKKLEALKELGDEKWKDPEIVKLNEQIEIAKRTAQGSLQAIMESGDQSERGGAHTLLFNKAAMKVEVETSRGMSDQLNQLINRGVQSDINPNGLTEPMIRKLKSYRATTLGNIPPGTPMAELLYDLHKNPGQVKTIKEDEIIMFSNAPRDPKSADKAIRTKLETLQFMAIKNPESAARVMKELGLGDDVTKLGGYLESLEAGTMSRELKGPLNSFDPYDLRHVSGMQLYGNYVKLRGNMEQLVQTLNKDVKLGGGITNEIFSLKTVDERVAKLQELGILLTDAQKKELQSTGRTYEERRAGEDRLALDGAAEAYMRRFLDIERFRDYKAELTETQRLDRIQNFKDVVTGLSSDNPAIREVAKTQMQFALLDTDPDTEDFSQVQRHGNIVITSTELAKIMQRLKEAEQAGTEVKLTDKEKEFLANANGIISKNIRDELQGRVTNENDINALADIIFTENQIAYDESSIGERMSMEQKSREEIRAEVKTEEYSKLFLRKPTDFTNDSPLIAKLKQKPEYHELPNGFSKYLAEQRVQESITEVVAAAQTRLQETAADRFMEKYKDQLVGISREDIVKSFKVKLEIDELLAGKKSVHGIAVPDLTNAFGSEAKIRNFYDNLAQKIVQNQEARLLSPENIDTLKHRSIKAVYDKFGKVDVGILKNQCPYKMENLIMLDQSLGTIDQVTSAYKRLANADDKTYAGADGEAKRAADLKLAEQYLFTKHLAEAVQGDPDKVEVRHISIASILASKEILAVEEARKAKLEREKAELGTAESGASKLAVSVTGNMIAATAATAQEGKLAALTEEAKKQGALKGENVAQIVANENAVQADGEKEKRPEEVGTKLAQTGTKTDGKEKAAGDVQPQQVAKAKVEDDKAAAAAKA